MLSSNQSEIKTSTKKFCDQGILLIDQRKGIFALSRVVILTSNEIRHDYFRKYIANDERIDVLASYCEGKPKSLRSVVKEKHDSNALEFQHARAREQFEIDFFKPYIDNTNDKSNPQKIKEGDVNNDNIVSEIINLEPELLVCYGSSLIKSKLLDLYEGRFLNVHLGLSPYYRGSGTNVWPLINNEPDMVGATFMHIDRGIDTGKIIHQIRADIYLGDSPHSIGNRLIKKMTKTYGEVIVNFKSLEVPDQPKSTGKLYFRKNFDHNACRALYDNFSSGLIEDYLKSKKQCQYIVKNKALNL